MAARVLLAPVALGLAGCAPEVEIAATGSGGGATTSSSSIATSPTSTGSGGSGAGTTASQGGAGGAGAGASGQGGDLGGAGPGAGAAPCLGVAYKIVYFDGDATDFVHPGADAIVDAKWTANALEPDHLGLELIPMDYDQGSSWLLDFSTAQMGQKLDPGVYPDAMRWPYEQPGHPGLSVRGNTSGCDDITGELEVLESEVAAELITKLTVSFVQHCEGQPPALRGCLHWE